MRAVLFAIQSLPEQEKLRKIEKRTRYDILEDETACALHARARNSCFSQGFKVMRERRFSDLYAEIAAGFLGCGCQLSDDLEPDGITQGIDAFPVLFPFFLLSDRP